ncbi:SMI1/KNR4 family protein [Cerasicoccus frondis]|uniref:SMI1/KNR4 family protein n=1 Tax=Cerasicoccus frondis TaxID=490090 RepID=UPI002852BF2E|nr:SMI1/KNR4 family protein [Cerasicoccus frondis]
MFLTEWASLNDDGGGVSEKRICETESRLGAKLPERLRGFYLHFGGNLDSFVDDENRFLPLEKFRISPDYLPEEWKNTDCAESEEIEKLIFADNCWGGYWGVATRDLATNDPPMSCVDSCGSEMQGTFGLSAFIIGVVFRAAVRKAPIVVKLDQNSDNKLIEEISQHFDRTCTTWERDDIEQEFGFMAHYESEKLISYVTHDTMLIGMKTFDVIADYPRGIHESLISRSNRPADPGS